MTFEATIGLYAGYGHGNTAADQHEVTKLCRSYQEGAEQWYTSDPRHEAFGIYPSAVAAVSHTFYREAWGCPHGGEPAVTFRGTFNPAYLREGITVEDAAALWREGVRSVLTHVMKSFGQERATLVFQEIPETIENLFNG